MIADKLEKLLLKHNFNKDINNKYIFKSITKQIYSYDYNNNKILTYISGTLFINRKTLSLELEGDPDLANEVLNEYLSLNES